MTIILASASPRRRELFRRTGLPFTVADSGIHEEILPLEPAQLALRLAREKARAVASVSEEQPVLAADTVIDLDGETLGKPDDPQHAVRMLDRLRGRTHRVITALVLLQGDEQLGSHVSTEVKMRDYSSADIEYYVRSGEPIDKAGAYAIQGLGGSLVEAINGCYFNVIGLPLCEVARLFHRFGISMVSDGPLCLQASGAPCPRSERPGQPN